MNCKRTKMSTSLQFILLNGTNCGATSGLGEPTKDRRLEIKGSADSWLLPGPRNRHPNTIQESNPPLSLFLLEDHYLEGRTPQTLKSA